MGNLGLALKITIPRDMQLILLAWLQVVASFGGS
jgi:hypothetical protein